jgi:hypothetical protein
MDYLVQSLWDKSSSWDTMALMHLTSNHTKTKTLSFLSLGSSLPLIFCIHVRSGPIYWEGYLPCRKDYKVMVCKKPKNIICDSILHVNMFHYFRIPYLHVFFYKIYLQWIHWTLFFIARCSTNFAQWSPRDVRQWIHCINQSTMVSNSACLHLEHCLLNNRFSSPLMLNVLIKCHTEGPCPILKCVPGRVHRINKEHTPIGQVHDTTSIGA